MKTSLVVLTLCSVLYAGIGALKNINNSLTNHKHQLENAVAMEK